MANNPATKRARLVPPHVTLRSLRQSKGLTLERVCIELERETGLSLTRGALSAIESGLRGASAQIIRGLEQALDLEPGNIVTDYEPRERSERVA